MKSKPSAEEAEKESDHPILATSIMLSWGILWAVTYSTATFYADNGLVVDLCSTIPTIHISVFKYKLYKVRN
jgi:hypothetical protein